VINRQSQRLAIVYYNAMTL